MQWAEPFAISPFEKPTGNQIFTLKTTGVVAGTYFLTARLDGKFLETQKVILE